MQALHKKLRCQLKLSNSSNRSLSLPFANYQTFRELQNIPVNYKTFCEPQNKGELKMTCTLQEQTDNTAPHGANMLFVQITII